MKYDITLKKIKVNESFSRETICFTADIIVDGVQVARAENDGHGGNTFIYPYEGMNTKLKEVEAYVKTLPPDNTAGMELPMDLELFIDLILDEHTNKNSKEKFAKKLLKNMDKGICYGTADSYRIINWKSFTVTQLLTSHTGREAIRKVVTRLIGEGETILNTNLPTEILKK